LIVTQVRITVLERTMNAHLAEAYCAHQPVRLCPLFQEGQEFVLERPDKPERFCSDAWNSLQTYVFAFIAGGRGFYGDWMKDPDTMIACCNDGIRPVIFKLERVEA
jgi:uncharacterized repeat protein (TIGR04076 family)